MSRPIMDRTGQQILMWGAERQVSALLAQTYVDSGAQVSVIKDSRGLHGDMPDEVLAIECEPSKPRDLRTLAADLDEDEHGIDVLVILHEEHRPGPLLDNSIEDWKEALQHNVHLPLQVVQAALSALKKARGNIAFLGNIGGLHAFDSKGPSAVARQSLHNLARYMTTEWFNDGIRVNTVAVSSIAEDSVVNDVYLPRAQCLHRQDHADLKPGYALPAEVVDVFDFITSDRARWLTGQLIKADGGMTMALDFDFFLRLTNYT